MKQVLYLIMLLVMTAACSKKNTDPVPTGATLVAGTYDVSRVTITGAGASNVDATLPQTATVNGAMVTRSATVEATKFAESVIIARLVFKTTGQPDSITELGNIEVRGAELYQSNGKVGMADGTTFSFDAPGLNGSRLVLISKKR